MDTMARQPLHLRLLSGNLAVSRLDPQAEIPSWAVASLPFSVTRTQEELSIICPESCVPAGIVCERGWRILQFEGPFDFGAVGVLASVADPLAAAGISILALATYDTDYVLVREALIERAVTVLRTHGHTVRAG